MIAKDSVPSPAANNTYIVYKKKTVLDFEGLALDGKKKNPSAMLIFSKTRAAFSLLIDMNRSFSTRIVNSSLDIQAVH